MTASLYCDVKGSGKDVVLLHGWGMHGGIWGKFSELLSKSCKTHVIDLPGLGYSHDIENEFTLDAITLVIEEYINKDIQQPVILIGWSLGGLLALNILQRNNVEIDKVIFVATTPCFTKKNDWANAVEKSVFNDFAKDLENDYKKTLKRFLALQARGSDLARDELRELNKVLNERGDPNFDALKSGLNILESTDLRSQKKNEITSMMILGKKDTLVPFSISNEFETMFPNIEKVIIEKSGHAPFITKPEFCAEKIKNFINE